MEWTLFNNSQQNTKEDIWILASNPWLLVCSHLTIRWGGTPCCRLVGGTLSGNMPGYSVVWCPRQHSHTSQLNIIARGSHRRKEEKERRRRRDLYSTTSPTPQHVYRPQSVMWCVTRTEPAWRIVVIRRGASRAEGKPPKPETIVVIRSRCHYQKSLLSLASKSVHRGAVIRTDVFGGTTPGYGRGWWHRAEWICKTSD